MLVVYEEGLVHKVKRAIFNAKKNGREISKIYITHEERDAFVRDYNETFENVCLDEDVTEFVVFGISVLVVTEHELMTKELEYGSNNEN